MKEILNTKINFKIEDFAKDIEDLAKNKSELIFHNDIAEHTAIVLTNMLNFSETLCIYDNNLNGDVTSKYEDFLPSFRNFIEEGKTIKIVLREKTNIYENKKFYEEVKKYLLLTPKTIKVKLASDEFKNIIINTFDDNINFAVGDKNKFRIEKQNDSKKRDAFCCFNNEEIAGELRKIFKENFKSCSPYF